ncbi:hypothetical protein HYR99_36300 [Candidatus Poribacteria bacterium]|nr:hypothetical protein [Candidatus Poribacteria bacterium]
MNTFTIVDTDILIDAALQIREAIDGLDEKERKERKNGRKVEDSRDGGRMGGRQPPNLPIFQPSNLVTFHVSRFTFYVSPRSHALFCQWV